MKIISVPIRTNKPLRESRLISSLPNYIKRSIITIIRMYSMFQPLRVFFYVGSLLFLVGSAGVFRFLYYFFTGNGAGHIQSVVLSGVFIILGFMLVMIGLVADLVSFNRRLIEDTLYRIRKTELALLSTNAKEKTARWARGLGD